MKKSMDAKRFGALIVLPLLIGAAPLAASAEETLKPSGTEAQAPVTLEAPAVSEQPVREAAPGVQAPQATEAMPDGVASEDLIGKPVMAADGKSVGTVAAIKSDQEGKLVSVHIETGGLFGFGAKLREVPAGEFTRTEEGIQLRLASNEIDKLGEVEPPKG